MSTDVGCSGLFAFRKNAIRAYGKFSAEGGEKVNAEGETG